MDMEEVEIKLREHRAEIDALKATVRQLISQIGQLPVKKADGLDASEPAEPKTRPVFMPPLTRGLR